MGAPRKSYRLWVLGGVLRALCGLLILAVVLLLLWRVYFSGILPKSMKRLSPNPTLKAAYAASGGELELFTQKQATITKVDGYNYGYFGVPRFVFIPAASQVQVVLRYNNSTLKKVQSDLGLEAPLPRGQEIFDVTVVSVRDLTPDDTTDNEDGNENIGQTRVVPTSVQVDTTALYTYFLYTFDGVDVGADVLAIYLDIYYGTDYSQKALGTLRLYHYQTERQSVRLTAKERRALTD